MEQLFFEGLLLQASLILALGAQNIFVLESGLRRQHHLTVSLVCFLCDFVLIMLGVAGAASLFSAFPKVKILIGVVGVAFMLHYGISKIVSKSESLFESGGSLSTTLKRSIILSITFSIFNPHAYLDAFVLIGGFSSKYSLLSDRIVFGFGAACFSGIWFLMLSSASSYMKPVLENPRRMKGVMLTAGLALIMLSGKLSVEVYGWINEASSIPFTVRSFQYPLPAGKLFTSILF